MLKHTIIIGRKEKNIPKEEKMLRIIAGKYRHLQINAPDVDSTRPTTDKVREALMSALAFDIVSKDVLDLFAGSGALGLESLSRGASSCYFVDTNLKAYKTIKDNIKSLKISEHTEVFLQDYKSFLNNNKDKKFGVVFLDPPYKMKNIYDEVVDFMLENDMLTEDAVIVKESDVHFEEDERFRKYKKYKYGIIHVSVYWR